MIIDNLEFLGEIFFIKNTGTGINVLQYAHFLDIHHTTLTHWLNKNGEPTLTMVDRIIGGINDMLSILSDGKVMINSEQLMSVDLKSHYFDNKKPYVPDHVIRNMKTAAKNKTIRKFDIPLLKYLPETGSKQVAKIGELTINDPAVVADFAIKLPHNLISTHAETGDIAVITSFTPDCKVAIINYRQYIVIGKPIQAGGDFFIFHNSDNIYPVQRGDIYKVVQIINYY